MVGENDPWHMKGLRVLLRDRGLLTSDGRLDVGAVDAAFDEKDGSAPPAMVALRQWAFERAQQIIGTTAMTEDVIESADAILAWVTKRNTNG